MRVLHVSGWLMLVAGVVLQMWFRDSISGWALVFYGTPKPCLIMLALVLAAWPRATRWLRALAFSTAVVLSIWWVSVSWCAPQKMQAAGPTKNEVTLLFWNLCRPNGLDQEMVDLVKELKPQLAAFVEPGGNAGKLLEAYKSLLPGYEVAWMPRGILWLSQVPAPHHGRGKLDYIGAYARFDVSGLGPTFPLVVADVHPYLFHSRHGQLQEALLHTQDRRDAILVGDFNTPLESVLLADYRKAFVEAFEVAGSGFKETWPSGLPLLSLDHVWVGPDWDVVTARKIWRLTGSDHAALFVTLRRK